MFPYLLLIVIPIVAIGIQKTMFKSQYPIGRYNETKFSYHEYGISKKPSDYPKSPKIDYTINP